MAELARADGSLSTLNAVHSGLAMTSIGLLGSKEQKQRWLPAMATFERTGAFALTEPTHGTDVVNLETTAHRDGDEWVINGAKRWIGNGHVADIVVVWARDDDGKVGGFIVEHPDGIHDPVHGFEAVPIKGQDRRARHQPGADRPDRRAHSCRLPARAVPQLRRHQHRAGEIPADRRLGGSRTRYRRV